MAEHWIYVQHPKTSERHAVLAENYADTYAAGFRPDPDYGDQDAPKAAKASDDAHKPATAKSEA